MVEASGRVTVTVTCTKCKREIYGTKHITHASESANVPRMVEAMAYIEDWSIFPSGIATCSSCRNEAEVENAKSVIRDQEEDDGGEDVNRT